MFAQSQMKQSGRDFGCGNDGRPSLSISCHAMRCNERKIVIAKEWEWLMGFALPSPLPARLIKNVKPFLAFQLSLQILRRKQLRPSIMLTRKSTRMWQWFKYLLTSSRSHPSKLVVVRCATRNSSSSCLENDKFRIAGVLWFPVQCCSNIYNELPLIAPCALRPPFYYLETIA